MRIGHHVAALINIPSPFGQEAAVADYCTGVLEASGFLCVRDAIGNVMAKRGDGIVPLLVAHMDTHPDGFGYDDKVGLGIIMEIAQHHRDAFKVLLTVQDEQGQHGARAVPAEWFEDVLFALVLHRHGTTDFVASVFGRPTCRSAFKGMVHRLLAEWGYECRPTDSVSSDVVPIGAHVNAVNVGIGFYNEHTRAEGYNPAEARLSLTAVLALVRAMPMR